MSNEINHNPANDWPIGRVDLDEDTEGHARTRLSETDDEDTEGHARTRLSETDDEDTEGHIRI